MIAPLGAPNKVVDESEHQPPQGSSLGPTQARVGDPLTIAVDVQGVVGSGGDSEMAIVQHVQAWACYPSPTPGRASAALVLPSMQISNPTFAGNQPVFGSNPVFNPDDYQNAKQDFYALLSLSGVWTPTAKCPARGRDRR